MTNEFRFTLPGKENTKNVQTERCVVRQRAAAVLAGVVHPAEASRGQAAAAAAVADGPDHRAAAPVAVEHRRRRHRLF